MDQQTSITELAERVARLETNRGRRRVYNLQQAAARLNMSVSKLRALHNRGIGPQAAEHEWPHLGLLRRRARSLHRRTS
jgi:hypothetical protein